MMTNTLAHLKKSLLRRAACVQADEFIIRGVWDFTMRSQPNDNERTFTESGCLVATSGLGASFRAGSQSVPIPDSLMGQDGRQVVADDRALQVAILDACYAVLPQSPTREHVLDDDAVKKSTWRAKIVSNQVKLIANRLGIPKPSVLMIGVVRTIAEQLHNHGMAIVLNDLDPRIVGSKVAGAEVQLGRLNGSLLRECDIILATGMTITTETLDEIVATVQQYAKPVVMFAQTGSNFAEEYLALGIETVVAEPYPWYCLPGKSVIRVFRRS